MSGARRTSVAVLVMVVATGALASAQAGRPRARDFYAPVLSWAASESRLACSPEESTPMAVAAEDRIGLIGEPIALPDGSHVAIVRTALGRRDPSGTEASRLFVVGLRARTRGRGWDARRLELELGGVDARRTVVHAARLEDVDDDGEIELFLDLEVAGGAECEHGRCTVRRLWLLDVLHPDALRGALLERSFGCDGAAAERRTAEVTLRDVDADAHRDIVVAERRCVLDRRGESVCTDSEQVHVWNAERDGYALR